MKTRVKIEFTVRLDSQEELDPAWLGGQAEFAAYLLRVATKDGAKITTNMSSILMDDHMRRVLYGE